MFEKEKNKSEPFAFFKLPIKKPSTGKRILNGTLYAIVNMVKWNMLTLLTFWTIALAFFGVDYLFFAQDREAQQVVWQQQQNEEEKQYAIDLDKFNSDLIQLIKNKSLPDMQQELQKNPQVKTTLMTGNVFEFARNSQFRGSEEFLLNLDKNKPTLYVKNVNDSMEESLKKLEKEGKISLREIPYNEYRKTLEVHIK